MKIDNTHILAKQLFNVLKHSNKVFPLEKTKSGKVLSWKAKLHKKFGGTDETVIVREEAFLNGEIHTLFVYLSTLDFKEKQHSIEVCSTDGGCFINTRVLVNKQSMNVLLFLSGELSKLENGISEHGAINACVMPV